MGHMVTLKLPYVRRQELAPRDAWLHPSCPEPGLGSTGHVAAPELPRARRWELTSWEVWQHPSCLCRVA
jgi:hypothetical protein